MGSIQSEPVPAAGELVPGAVYARRELHDRFGGNRQAGIAPSSKEDVVLLFHTEEKVHQFYGDGWDADGIYWYSGEGVLGDMEWTNANLAIRDHRQDGKVLWLFERAQREDGLWQFAGEMRYLAHRSDQRPDKQGKSRQAIVFALLRAGGHRSLPMGS